MARFIPAIVLLLFCCIGLYAQQHNFRTYSLEEGLPQSEVRALIQDRSGNLWLGTNGGGLCRFNGKEFQVFTKKHGLPDNIVGALHQDRNGLLWAATSRGIAVYDGKSFRIYSQAEGVQDGIYFWINEDNQGRIWVLGVENQGSRKVLYLEDDQFRDFTQEYPELSDDNFIIWVFQDRNQNFQIVTPNGSYQFDGDRLTRSPLQDLVPANQMTFPFLQDSKGYLWMAAGEFPKVHDLYRIKDNRMEKVKLPVGISPEEFNYAFEDSKGNVWISIFGTGLLKTANHDKDLDFQVFTRRNGLPITFINNILEDREGNIWLGSNGGGLLKYSSEKFIALNSEDGLDSEIIRAITQDSKGTYWFGTAGGAIIKYDGNSVVNVITEEESPLGFIRKFLELENGNLLIASFNGLWNYNGKTFEKVNRQFGLSDPDRVADMIRDGNEYLISVFGKGVARYNGRETTFITAEKDSIATNNITHLMKDSQGNIWMASNLSGVTKYQADPLNPLEPQTSQTGSRSVKFNSQNALNNDYILQIAEDKNGHLWLASYGGGLNIYDGNEFRYLDTENGLTSDNIYSVIADSEGNIWAGTQNGVDKITLSDQGEILSIVNYDKHDGFIGIEANGMANFMDRDKNLWFGTIKGVMRYSPSADEFNPIPPVTNITKMRLFFKDVDWNQQEFRQYLQGVAPWHHLPQQLSLPYDLNHVSFNFEALSFQVPEKVKYQWKLDGLDKDWTPVSDNTEAVYPNLPPGDYTFLVRASNNDGVWNEQPASFSFSVTPPWWGTWWFRFLSVLWVLALAFTFYKWRVRSIKEKRNELQRLVEAKTKEVVHQKDEILVQSKKLQQSYQNLELLSEVGKSITANLSVSKIVDTVHHNVNSLMSAHVFWIGLHNPEKDTLEFTGALEDGQKLPPFEYQLSDDNRLAVWCFKNQQEVYINDYEKEYQKYLNERSAVLVGKPTKSIIYVPLISLDKAFGVLSVQSYEKNAYDEQHLSLIRNIAVHTKIALENASAYEKITQQSIHLHQQKQQIESKNLELLELNKEKNHLIGIVAHDLRNPLTSALTIGGILKGDPSLNDELREYTEHMLNAMDRMNTMVSRILDIKAIESKGLDLNLARTNLAEVLEEVHQDFREALVNKKLEFTITHGGLQPYANVDRNYMTQIYENLISNAIKFSPPQRRITVRFEQDNGRIITSIKDQGPGLTANDKRLLFQKYQKLSARPTAGEQSTGLGLSIVKKYVEAMNGTVWCESEPGQGATFKVQFAYQE